MDAKQAAESEAARCASRLDLANRLVNALGSESERWNNAIITLTQDIELVVGDVLLASSFVSYVGPFSKQYREMIIKDNFIQFFKKNNMMLRRLSGILKSCHLIKFQLKTLPSLRTLIVTH